MIIFQGNWCNSNSLKTLHAYCSWLKMTARVWTWHLLLSSRSNSPAAFLDIQGSVPRPLFQAPPVHHKPFAPPETRTYDPVTGKLIRRGPQASRPPSYLHSHGSSMSAKGDLSTLRYFLYFYFFIFMYGSSRTFIKPSHWMLDRRWRVNIAVVLLNSWLYQNHNSSIFANSAQYIELIYEEQGNIMFDYMY